MSKTKGFTLIELAIVLFILTLLLSSLLVPLATQVDQRNISDTQKKLEEIKEALIGYAASQTQPHLPCPDITSGVGANDGQEDFNLATGVCTAQEGNIPWVTLGVAPSDSWGNRIHYSVSSVFSNRPPAATMNLSSSGTLTICPAAACASSTAIATNVPAVILSYGKNGYGAINGTSNTQNPGPTSADEVENTNGDFKFVSRSQTDVNSSVGEFDDIVVWLSSNVVFNRMIAAGKLP
jgi:prepilin-type N-terminal cleavage/methylation domain-containing protein